MQSERPSEGQAYEDFHRSPSLKGMIGDHAEPSRGEMSGDE
jgi:hypothetical protein